MLQMTNISGPIIITQGLHFCTWLSQNSAIKSTIFMETKKNQYLMQNIFHVIQCSSLYRYKNSCKTIVLLKTNGTFNNPRTKI